MWVFLLVRMKSNHNISQMLKEDWQQWKRNIKKSWVNIRSLESLLYHEIYSIPPQLIDIIYKIIPSLKSYKTPAFIITCGNLRVSVLCNFCESVLTED